MPNAFWAAVPTTVVGSVSGASGNVTLNTHLSEFLIDESTESFFAQFNNEKYERDGGVISHTKTATITSHDMTTIVANGGLDSGDYWSTCVATYVSEGGSANAVGYGTLTATIHSMLIESSSKTDSGGRLAVNATARLVSDDGSTDPVVWAVA